MKHINPLGIFIFLWFSLMACNEPDLVQPGPATPAPTQTSPAPSPEPTAPAGPLQASTASLDPQVTAAQLTFLSWSPDSTQLAYLEHTPEDLASNPQFPPGSLKFLTIATGQTCDTALIFPPNNPSWDKLAWLAGGTVLVSLEGQILHGTPCQADFEALSGLPPSPGYTIASHTPDRSLFLLADPQGYWLYEPASQATRRIDEAVHGHSAGYSWSPQHQRLAISAVTTSTNAGVMAATYVVEVATGRLEEVIEYEQRAGLGNLPGPTWLAEDRLLIAETLDRGPLLWTVGQEALPVAPELFGLPAELGAESEVTLIAGAARGEESAEFHLVLSGGGVEVEFPPVRLYHSESGQVEELPFLYTGGPVFSPDGQWLVLAAHPIKDGYESYEAWVRPVDPVGAEAKRLFGSSSAISAWSPDWTQVAATAPDGISLVSLPEGTQSNILQGGPYTLTPLAWSPDSQFLAALGYLQDGQGQGLFVIPRAP